MNHQLHTEEDFLKDETFVKWVQDGDPDLQEFWEQWLTRHPDRKEAFMKARTLLVNLKFSNETLSEAKKEALWARIASHTDHSSEATASVRWGLWARGLAAAVVLLLGTWAGWTYFMNVEIILNTGYGEQRVCVLSDGTRVTLNANSRLRYRRGDVRRVWLKGEAYFEVSKKPQTQADFVVHTDDLSIKVLGTIFNVSRRQDTTEVFLEEGKVSLALEVETRLDTQQTIQMAPGDLVRYSKKARKLSHTNQANALENTSWKDGSLIFRNAALSRVLTEVSELYGISFHLLQPELKDKKITGGLPIKNLDITLETLGGIYDLHINAKGDTYYINQ